MSRHRMAPGDAAWLHMDRPVNELIVNAVLWFDEPIDLATLREVVAERLTAAHPRFAQTVVDEGATVWWQDDPHFDLHRHVHRSVLDASADLAAHVTGLLRAPLPRDRALWQLELVEYAGGCAVVARIHHCIADGVALFRVLMSLTDEAQAGDTTPPADAVPQLPSQPGRLTRLVRGTRALAAMVALPPDARTALRAPLGTVKSVAWSAPIPLETLRQASRAAGGTINDVVLAALAGGLRRHLLAVDGRARDVRAVLPVNLRPIDLSAPIELGNRFGLVFLRLPVAVDDMARRVGLVQARSSALKRSAAAPVALGILQIAGRGPSRVMQVLISLFSAKASAVVTNVRGPATPVHLAGRRLIGAIAWPPQSGTLGLGVSVISYGGSVIIGMMADDQLFDGPHALLADTCAELRTMGVDVPETAAAA